MKTTEKHRLLVDVLHDEGYREFRETLRAEVLGQLRRRRAHRHAYAGRLLPLAACLLVLLGVIQWRWARPPSAVLTVLTGSAPAAAVVRTVPLHPANIISTRRALAIPSADAPSGIFIVLTTAEGAGIVRTRAQGLDRLSDPQLLDLFKGQAVALVGSGPGHRQLLFPGQTEALP